MYKYNRTPLAHIFSFSVFTKPKNKYSKNDDRSFNKCVFQRFHHHHRPHRRRGFDLKTADGAVQASIMHIVS
jgi:hypothetical protein